MFLATFFTIHLVMKNVVDVDHSAFFNLVDVDLPFSTCLFLVVDFFLTGRPAFFKLVDVLVDHRRSSTPILQPFSSPPSLAKLEKMSTNLVNGVTTSLHRK